MYLTVQQYTEGTALLTTQIDADHGAGTVAALPPGFLSTLLADLMQFLLPMLGCLTPTPPAPTPTPPAVKAAAAAQPDYFRFELVMSTPHAWRSLTRKFFPSVQKVVAGLDETPTGLLAGVLANTDPNA
jgi:hypothetical protein